MCPKHVCMQCSFFWFLTYTLLATRLCMSDFVILPLVFCRCVASIVKSIQPNLRDTFVELLQQCFCGRGPLFRAFRLVVVQHSAHASCQPTHHVDERLLPSTILGGLAVRLSRTSCKRSVLVRPVVFFLASSFDRQLWFNLDGVARSSQWTQVDEPLR